MTHDTHGGQERQLTAAAEPAEVTAQAGEDQVAFEHRYGHGRMPTFMKLIWLGFLVFGAWYVATFLLTALADDLSG